MQASEEGHSCQIGGVRIIGIHIYIYAKSYWFLSNGEKMQKKPLNYLLLPITSCYTDSLNLLKIYKIWFKILNLFFLKWIFISNIIKLDEYLVRPSS